MTIWIKEGSRRIIRFPVCYYHWLCHHSDESGDITARSYFHILIQAAHILRSLEDQKTNLCIIKGHHINGYFISAANQNYFLAIGGEEVFSSDIARAYIFSPRSRDL